jgi:adenylyltransferase/sulfurtransferase
MNRYHRQTLLSQIGEAGQERLARGRVLLIGCGALGTVIADQLMRAGVGFLRILDRDIVELTNLQRQVLFDESDARDGLPKAVAAARRLGKINSQVQLEPIVADVESGNIERLCEGVELILDGTDNVATRYLINDVAVKNRIAWIYGACVGTEGRVMPVLPGGACLRCVFPEPPAAGELPTCDTAGVLGAAAAIVGAIQATEAIRLLVGGTDASEAQMVACDVWTRRYRTIDLRDARRADCPTCGRRDFQFLNDTTGSAVQLCGRNSVQIRPHRSYATIDADAMDQKLRPHGEVIRTPYFVRVTLNGEQRLQLTIFMDGRTIVHGTSDPARARAIHARYVGA